MPYVRKIHLCQDPEAARHETRGTFFKCLPKDAGFGKRAAKKESNSKKIAEKITNTMHYTRSPSQIANSVEDNSGNFTEFLSRPAFRAILKFIRVFLFSKERIVVYLCY